MRLVFTAFLCVLASCSSPAKATASGARAHSAGDLGLRPVSGPLVFPDGAQKVTLAWLVDELARLTGQELVYEPEVRQQLEQAEEPLEITASVAAEEVYPFIESLLVFRGYVLARLKDGEPTVLGVIGPTRGQWRPAEGIVAIEAADFAALARHPALLVQLAMHFENIDTRQLQTQLRQLLVDPSGLCNVVPAGERSLILQGYGARVSNLLGLLGEVDRNSAARPIARQTQAEQAATPR